MKKIVPNVGDQASDSAGSWAERFVQLPNSPLSIILSAPIDPRGLYTHEACSV